MRRFFHGKKLKIVIGVVAILTVITIVVSCLGGWSSPLSGFAGSVVAPVQNFATWVSDSVSDFFSAHTKYDQLEKENAELRKQINTLTKEKLDWQEAVNENAFYEDFLDLKEEHDDFKFRAARIIARDSADAFGTLTIDAGSLQGVSPHDPVITADGLVGYIGTVAPNYSTVVTILDPSLNVGAYDRRTNDSGIVSGDVASAAKGLCRINNISRFSAVAMGDYIVTSGGAGVFPSGLIIGSVKSVAQDEDELTLHAEVKPAADIFNCHNVMVITSFTGQSSFDNTVS